MIYVTIRRSSDLSNSDIAGTTSQRGHKFAQVFATSYGWSRTIPMTKKSDTPQSTYEASMTKRQPGKTILTSQRKMVDAPTLAKTWNIPLERAKTTIIATTHRGIRHVTNPSIMKRFPTNDRMLRYNRLPHPLFTDTLLAGTTSQRSHKFAQVFATSYGWSHLSPKFVYLQLIRATTNHQHLKLA